MFRCLVCTPFCNSLRDAYWPLSGADLCLQSPVLWQVGPLVIPIIPIGLLHHSFSTSSGSFPAPVGHIHCSETSPGNPQLWKDSSQVSVIASQVEEAGRGDPCDLSPAGLISSRNPGCRTSAPPGRGRGPQCRDTQRGPFTALQLATLLSERQSVPLSPAHAGRMKEN